MERDISTENLNVFRLQEAPDYVPLDVIDTFKIIYEQASIGRRFHSGSVLEFAPNGPAFMQDPVNAGFLFTRYQGQVLQDVPLPRPPYLFGILLRGLEIEWAKRFPSRLLIRSV